jgi:hypothetical protein
MFTHVGLEQWHYDMIIFNSSAVYTLPSWNVQSMLNNASHGHTVTMSSKGSAPGIFKAGP